jgi:hypothetical protein
MNVDIMAKSIVGTPLNLGGIIEHITNFTEVRILSINQPFDVKLRYSGKKSATSASCFQNLSSLYTTFLNRHLEYYIVVLIAFFLT